MSTPTVADVMTSPVMTVPDTAAMGWVEANLRILDARHMPVVDATGTMVGMLCSHDVDRALRDGGHHVVTEYMARHLHTVAPTATLHEAIAAMHGGRVHALAVVDGGGRPIGIVTDHDLLRALDDAVSHA